MMALQEKLESDREQLVALQGELFLVEGALVDRYNMALERINGKKVDLKRFYVDRRGESPEIERILGSNYLQNGPANRYIIILSPDQENAPLIHMEYSYDDELIDAIYKKFRETIREVATHHPLYGEFLDKIPKYTCIEDLLDMDSVEVRLDTPDERISKIHRFRENIRKNYGIWFNTADEPGIQGLMQMCELAKELNTAQKDIRQINVSQISQEFPVESYYTRFFDQVWVIRDVKVGKQKRTYLIHTLDHAPESLGDDVVAVRYDDPQLIDDLVAGKLLGYEHLEKDPGFIEGRKETVLDMMLLGHVHDITQIDSTERYRLIDKYETPEVYAQLKSVKSYLKRNGTAGLSDFIAKKSLLCKAKLAMPVKLDDILIPLLSKLDPSDYVRTFVYDRRSLEHDFEKMPENKRAYVLMKLKEHLSGGM